MNPKIKRHIVCPRCGAKVRIPLFWAVGIEGIFRCRECRLPFKTGYKTGAVLSALALCLSMATVQILVYLFSIYSMALFVLLLIPLWLFYAYHFRKWQLLRKARRTASAQRETDAAPDEGNGAETASEALNDKDPAI